MKERGMMLVNGREINYIDAQLKMACDLEERSLVAERHEVLIILAEDVDEQRIAELNVVEGE